MLSKNTFFQDGQRPEEQEQQAKAFLRAKFDAEKRKRWAKQLEQEHGVQRTPSARLAKRRRLVVWMASAAAAILLLLIFFQDGIYTTASTPQQLAANYLAEAPFAHQGQRKSSEQIEALRATAIEQYMRKEYQAASESWAALQQHTGANEEDLFYLGLSYLYSGNYASAIDQLSSATAAPDRFAQERRWFLALAYIQAGRTGQGEQLLKAIAPAHFNHKKAQHLLQQIDQTN
ncbi:MAG: tetratricopeptide repeat protein [Bacteroidota bacterium]